jgi:hypothetical protein
MIDQRIFEIDGWMSEKELVWLHEQASRLPPFSFVVEIGAWLGRSTAAIATGLSASSHFLTIDTWQGQEDLRDSDHALARDEDLLDIFLTNMNRLGLRFNHFTEGPWETTLAYHVGDAQAAAKLISDDVIDMWFDDGDHRTLGKDADVWRTKLAGGCLLCGHDFSPAFPDIVKAVAKRFPGYKTYDTIWYARVE